MIVRLRVAAFLAVLLSPVAVSAAEPAPPPKVVIDADALAAIIDRHIAADWAARGITPAMLADDAEFARRVYLDVIGRGPKVSELREFLDSTDPNKRANLVEKLLTLPSHSMHFAAVARAAWLPQSVTNQQFAGLGFQLELWLRARYRDNTPADETVRKLLNATLRVQGVNPQANMRFLQGDPNDPESFQLISFYQANEGKPENVGSSISRLFLGVKLECAQCHDHPFAPYTKEQFWEFAAFFADLNVLPNTRPSEKGPTGPQADKNRLTIPNTSTVVVAKFFDGSDPQWSPDRSPRRELADWLTRSDNPYFANNLANRMWAHFFGIGILDPVDEPGENNQPTHPKLLDELGRAFAAGKFDNRLLIRAITRSKAYQLTSKLSHPTQANPRTFARMNVKGLTPSQLFDTLVAATGYREPGNVRGNTFPGFVQPGNPRSMFLNRFASTDRPTETSTTILQALMMMNGDFIDAQTNPTDDAKPGTPGGPKAQPDGRVVMAANSRGSEILGAVVDMPGWDTKRKLEAVFLTALSRQPTPEEMDKFSSYVDRGGAANDKKKALGDVFWVLLNSPEFLFNH